MLSISLPYKEFILDHFRNPRNFGYLEKKDLWAGLNNPFCGDKIRIEAGVENNKIVRVAFSGEGCVISIASGSILTEYIKQKSIKDIEVMEEREMLNLLGIELGPVRINCALLPLFALKEAVKVYNAN